MSMENPFPGLRPFEADESHLFFGRESASDDFYANFDNAVLLPSSAPRAVASHHWCGPACSPIYMAAAWRRPVPAGERRFSAPGMRPLPLSPGPCGHPGSGNRRRRTTTWPSPKPTIAPGGLRPGGVDPPGADGRGEKLLVLVDQFEELFRTQRIAADDADEAKAFVNCCWLRPGKMTCRST